MKTYDILIVGGGPAGLTAALYAARSGKSVLVLEKAGFGGQIAWSPRVENYPGVKAVSGAQWAEELLTQAMEQGAETDVGAVTGLRRGDGAWRAATEEGGEYAARSVIVAAGARHRPLGLPGEEELVGRGVSYCAVCDGDFYAGQDVAVAGGGDSALQEALLLSDICRRVYVVHRRENFRGEARLQEKLFARGNVERVAPAAVTGLLRAGDALRGVALAAPDGGAVRELPVSALFVALGLLPDTGPFAGLLPLDAAGYAAVGEDCGAGAPGLFAAGDCRAKTVRQLTTAVGDGAAAAVAACRYLDAL